jgi:hypothetical protein
LKDLLRCFGLSFGDAAHSPEPSVHIDHGRAPELTGLFGFGIAFFSPLLPT